MLSASERRLLCCCETWSVMQLDGATLGKQGLASEADAARAVQLVKEAELQV